ncbi:hypothetical protein EVAR_67663_1 [Eumeta japonica]|uniref:Uncharacterized protein n=1 Tax=Eumeta variegata TaxID=151549 RepID=A0A4C1ZAB2_EUMVA|nr:hypothetical protein EVAR_67663_1 [Eumeta japonica]
MEWNGMEWNGMEWNGMDGMEWNGMDRKEWTNGMEWKEWNGMEWNGMKEWNGMEWNGMEWNGNGMELNEWNGMECSTEIGIDSSTEIGIDSSTEIGIDSSTEIGINSSTEIGIDSSTEIGINSSTEIGIESSVEIETQIGAGARSWRSLATNESPSQPPAAAGSPARRPPPININLFFLLHKVANCLKINCQRYHLLKRTLIIRKFVRTRSDKKSFSYFRSKNFQKILVVILFVSDSVADETSATSTATRMKDLRAAVGFSLSGSTASLCPYAYRSGYSASGTTLAMNMTEQLIAVLISKCPRPTLVSA